MVLLSPLLWRTSSSELLLPLCRSISCSEELSPLVGVSGFVASCGRLRDAIAGLMIQVWKKAEKINEL